MITLALTYFVNYWIEYKKIEKFQQQTVKDLIKLSLLEFMVIPLIIIAKKSKKFKFLLNLSLIFTTICKLILFIASN